jgi:nitric oxide reductase NorQ protein
MAAKWTTEDLKVGLEMEATFWPNPVAGSKYRFRATHLDGLRAPKVVLCDDPDHVEFHRVRQGCAACPG